jgi:hypothetical protein
MRSIAAPQYLLRGDDRAGAPAIIASFFLMAVTSPARTGAAAGSPVMRLQTILRNSGGVHSEYRVGPRPFGGTTVDKDRGMWLCTANPARPDE